MPRMVTLPAAARENMSSTAREQVLEHAPNVVPSLPYEPPPGAFVGTSGQDVFYATPEPDVFVFNYQEVGQIDSIYGFDTSEDLLVFTNTQGVILSTNNTNPFSLRYGEEIGNQIDFHGTVVSQEDYALDVTFYDENGQGGNVFDFSLYWLL